MNKEIKIGAGILGGAALGSFSARFASVAINRTLLNKIDTLDDELDDMLSKRQLEMKSKLERRAKDLDLMDQSNRDTVHVRAELSRLKKDLLSTLRSDQMAVYKKIDAASKDYLNRTKNLSYVLALLGGFAGGVIVKLTNK